MAPGSTTRSAALDSGTVKTLCNLTDAQITMLRDTYSIQVVPDLAFLDKDDIDTILGNDPSTFIKRRKLLAVCQYVKLGNSITASTTMDDIAVALRSSSTRVDSSSSSSSTSARAPSPAPPPIRLYSNDFLKFSGNIEDQEPFKLKAEAQIGQTAFKFLLTRDAVTTKEKERDEELFNVFKCAFLDGTAYHLITQSLMDLEGNTLTPSGRHVWTQFLTWCNSGGHKNTILKNIKRDLKALKLYGDKVDGLKYVNQFILHHAKLVEIGAKSSESEMLVNFVKNIIDPDFDTIRQILENYNMEIDRGNRTLNTKEFFEMVQSRQRKLNEMAEADMDVKSCRYSRNTGDDSSSIQSRSSSKDHAKQIFSLPRPLWNDLSPAQRKCFLAHKRSVLDRRSLLDDRIKEILAGDSGDNGGKKSKKRKNIKALKVRRSGVSQPGVPSTEDVHIVMKSDNDMVSSKDDSETNSPSTSAKKKKVKTNKVLRKGSSHITNNNSVPFPFATILDSGTEWSVGGGPAWTIMKHHSQSLNMAAVDADMQSVPMKLCDAVTAVLCDDGQLSLLGVRRCGFSPTLTDNEAVINSHFIREAGWSVDCVAQRHGGTQSISPLKDETWPLKYNATKYKLYLPCRAPTATELRRHSIHWIDCHIEDLEIDKGTKPVRRRPVQIQSPTVLVPGPQAIAPELIDKDGVSLGPNAMTSNAKQKQPNHPVTHASEARRSSEDIAHVSEVDKPTAAEESPSDDKIDWRQTLGDLTELVAAKTIANTTQYYPVRIEAENRNYPRQHRQTRLHALHCARIPGRTCADTFFSSIKSICRYTCVQLFVATTWDFLWIRLLRRESQVPGAYINFCREVGAPNELLTNNSKVQSGRKFLEIDCKNKTSHIFTTPHCQNQNVAERKIQDVKHKAIMLLHSHHAPLLFWCFASMYIVDCLNHTAKRSLNWQVPQSLRTSNTVWQAIEYLSPGIKYPACGWQKGRFVGIAWKHGDPFTFRIWTESDDGDWSNRVELTRNVVRPRKAILSTEPEQIDPSTYDDLFSRDETIAKGALKTGRKRGRKLPASKSSDATTRKKRQRLSDNGNNTLNRAVSFAPTQDNIPATASAVDQNSSLVNEPPTSLEEPFISEDAFAADGIDLEEPLEMSPDPTEHSSDTGTINDDLNPADKVQCVGGASLVKINGFRWNGGQLQLRFLMDSEETQWVDFRDAKLDYPRQTATYIKSDYRSHSSNAGRDQVLSWANCTLCNLRQAVRRVIRLYDFYLDDDDNVKKIRRAVRAKKKKAGLAPRGPVFKFGIRVPRSCKEAIELDEKAGNTLWQDAIQKEMDALETLGCFEFHPKGYHPGEEYQSTRLRMIFDVKADTLRRKARLVAGGHLLDVLGADVYSSTVKSISVKMLHVITHSAKLEALCGDIGNVFVTAYTKEKVYTIAGPEFFERQGMTIIIVKALYGLATSSARFHDHLADTFRNMGFKPTRFDNDVWIRLHSDGATYEYICTHVDDFCIFSWTPQLVMDQITAVYTVKAQGPPDYYLGNDFKRDKKGRWCVGSVKYIKESIRHVEAMFGTLKQHDIPMVTGDHPELDDLPVLTGEMHQKYQMLVSVLNWIVALGRLDIGFATSSHS